MGNINPCPLELETNTTTNSTSVDSNQTEADFFVDFEFAFETSETLDYTAQSVFKQELSLSTGVKPTDLSLYVQPNSTAMLQHGVSFRVTGVMMLEGYNVDTFTVVAQESFKAAIAESAKCQPKFVKIAAVSKGHDSRRLLSGQVESELPLLEVWCIMDCPNFPSS